MSFAELFQEIAKIFVKYWRVFLINGLSNTLLLSVITLFFGTILGSLFALCKISKLHPFDWIIAAFVEVVRGTPTLLQLYIGYFIIPMIIPKLDPTPFTCVSIVLVLNSASYVSEVIRSGIEAVDIGQTEASRSLGVSASATMLHIVLPQALKNILPALGNEFITVVKETSLASTFFVGELMTSYLIVKGYTYSTLPCLIIVGATYFIVTFTLSKILSALERRMKSHA